MDNKLTSEAFWNRLDYWRKSQNLTYVEIERQCGWGEAKIRECKCDGRVLQTLDLYTLVSKYSYTGITCDYLICGIKPEGIEVRNKVINAYYKTDETTRGIVNKILGI